MCMDLVAALRSEAAALNSTKVCEILLDAREGVSQDLRLDFLVQPVLNALVKAKTQNRSPPRLSHTSCSFLNSRLGLLGAHAHG